MPRLSESTLRQLIDDGETSTVELKVASPRPDEMAERLCGLANAQGGFIIIGVEDETLKIVGVPQGRMALTIDVILRSARRIIKPELVLDPPEPEVYMLGGKKVVVAAVLPNRGVVYQAGGVSWVRRGTHTVALNVSEIMELAYDRGLIDWERGLFVRLVSKKLMQGWSKSISVSDQVGAVRITVCGTWSGHW